MDPFEYGDPYIEWNEEVSAREPDLLLEELIERHEMFEGLQAEVVKLLDTSYGFTLDEAEEAVRNSVADSSDIWNENADANDLAKLLASDED